MKARNKYFYFNIGLSKRMNDELRKECQRLGISKQEMIRSLVKDYFLRFYGKDIVLDLSKEDND